MSLRPRFPGQDWPRASALVTASFVATTLLLVRILYARQFFHAHLLWNLILAWTPALLALLAWHWRLSPWRLPPLGFLWLLFLPNAPYLVTDLIHLHPSGAVPLWYDAVLLFCFALVGVMLGLQSLRLMQGLVSGWFGPDIGWLFVAAVTGLSGLGIYIGRFLRWNSWDVFLHPIRLSADVLESLTTPHLLLRLLVVVSLFSLVTAVAYLLFPPAVPREEQVGNWLDSRT